MEAETVKERPNIRVEIQNDLLENMDVDEEEGEIVDVETNDLNTENHISLVNTKNDFQKRHFITGIDIFDKNEQKKLQERALRFALKPNEIRMFTQENLNQLYESLGIFSDNDSKVRFEAIHMIGCEKMDTQDITEYFSEFVPSQIEWISENSCNIVWLDKISTARALHYISKSVRGMPVRAENVFEDSFILSCVDDLGSDQINTFSNKNREVELKDDSAEPQCFDNSVDLSAINISIPPGYWRLGKETPKAKSLLMRFAFKIDKKPFKIEECATYYKKHSHATFGQKNNLSGKSGSDKGIFSRNKQINLEKNPWGTLAASWYEDAKYCEKEPILRNDDSTKQIDARLKLKAKRKFAVDQTKISELDNDAESETSEPNEIVSEKKSKVPRMRMYADDEEEKIKRKRLLQKLQKQSDRIEKHEIENSDLRNILRITNRASKRLTSEKINNNSDLALTLRNRNRNMMFSIKQESNADDFEESEDSESDSSRKQHFNRREPTAQTFHRNDERRHEKVAKLKDRIVVHRKRPHSIERPRRVLYEAGPRKQDREKINSKEKYHGRMYSSRKEKEDLDDRLYSQKPKSKIAVVIKTQVPKVASAIQSRKYQKYNTSSSEDNSSEDSESSSESDSDKNSSGSSSSSSSDSESSNKNHFRKSSRRIKV